MIASDAKPHAVVVGIPPAMHGKSCSHCVLCKVLCKGCLGSHLVKPGWCAGSVDIATKTIDIDLAKAGLHMMIEKPISMRPVEEVERLAQVLVAF